MLGDGEARTGDGDTGVGDGDVALGDGYTGPRHGDMEPGEGDAGLRDGDDSVPQSDLRPNIMKWAPLIHQVRADAGGVKPRGRDPGAPWRYLEPAEGAVVTNGVRISRCAAIGRGSR